ncbi:hypothetical protein TIFTF001_009133 [Ficus carica]|uniref:Uncharacterized protein n=1 Tax=Ficus carica TaxID=3494 RepID=A0AA88A9Y4_FICCA|nr:hypothetical protein TIFTF001_009133 [Ficus carica]
MGIKEWYKSSSGRRTILLGEVYNTKESGYGVSRHGWRSFWRKIKILQGNSNKNKNKMIKNKLCSSSSLRLQPSYDPTTYSKNFDQGMGWEEPDFLFRSFSARFADPSRIFPKTIVLLD